MKARPRESNAVGLEPRDSRSCWVWVLSRHNLNPEALVFTDLANGVSLNIDVDVRRLTKPIP